jgi:hypothetical protein
MIRKIIKRSYFIKEITGILNGRRKAKEKQ